MARFEFSTRKGDILMGATFSITQLRRQYADNGGKLTLRHRRYLSHYVCPYLSKGRGGDRQYAITKTTEQALETMPDLLRGSFRVKFQRADAAWFKANPWIGNSENEITQAEIDAEFGLTLKRDEEPHRWELKAKIEPEKPETRK